MKKFVIGGSPCTYWSVAQKKGREITASGVGWELFENYLYAVDKFNPDYFIYENNKSASSLIKEQISIELGVPLQYINSSLVSAQNRQRFYAHNIPNVPQPEDRGIILNDILESGLADREKSYCLKHQSGNTRDYFKKNHTQIAFEPIRIGDIGSGSQAHRVYSCMGKSVNITANGGGQGGKTGLYLCPEPENCCDKAKVYTVRDKHILDTKFGDFFCDIPDGYYIIRKLTPIECERLQTLPDNYTAGISATQRYKCLGNGWTAEIIKHIIRSAKIPLDEEIQVLSMYDGIATGRYCFDSLGYKNITYHAFEIDPHAMTIANKNYPDIIQHGDAYQLRTENFAV